VSIPCPRQDLLTLQALYDSGAEINIVNQDVTQHLVRARDIKEETPKAHSLEGTELEIQHPYKVTVESQDSTGTSKVVGPQTF
jgi:hypothetical protein